MISEEERQNEYMLNYVPKWPLYLHLFCSVFCLGSSAIFHLGHVHSDYWRNTLAKLDYGGINILIMGSAYPPVFYTMACSELHGIRNVFLIAITVIGLSSFSMFMSDTMNKAAWRHVRSGSFISLGAIAALPFVYICNTSQTQYLSEYDFPPWAWGCLSIVIGVVFYVSQFPECKCHRHCDTFGASHQIFHVCVVIGVFIHLHASYNLYINRFNKVCPI